MFVRALIVESIEENAILIPQQAVSRDPKGNPMVLVVDAEGKVQPRRIVVNRALGDQWLVSAGLTPGDGVIVEGMQRVRPGAAVKAVPFEGGRQQDAKPANTAQPAAPSH
jgi:membrane fusion protein (multidrug efflux system)